MRPQVLLLALAVVAVLAALPLAHGQGVSPWPCCDKCGVCTKSIPPQCRCQDVSPTGCNSACKSCVRSTAGFQCADSITNFCERRCTPAA